MIVLAPIGRSHICVSRHEGVGQWRRSPAPLSINQRQAQTRRPKRQKQTRRRPQPGPRQPGPRQPGPRQPGRRQAWVFSTCESPDCAAWTVAPVVGMAAAELSGATKLKIAMAAPNEMPVSMRRLSPVIFYSSSTPSACCSALAKIRLSRRFTQDGLEPVLGLVRQRRLENTRLVRFDFGQNLVFSYALEKNEKRR
jgi:hypothetical protein